MPSHLFAICFRATRPADLARFWSGVLGWEPDDGPTGGQDGGIAILLPTPVGSASASCRAGNRGPAGTGRTST